MPSVRPGGAANRGLTRTWARPAANADWAGTIYLPTDARYLRFAAWATTMRLGRLDLALFWTIGRSRNRLEPFWPTKGLGSEVTQAVVVAGRALAVTAAGVASYDPSHDVDGRVLESCVSLRPLLAKAGRRPPAASLVMMPVSGGPVFHERS
jgi:hypothetical protein